MGLHDGHRKRLKAQFLAHGEDFHDHQLLELLLCSPTPCWSASAPCPA